MSRTSGSTARRHGDGLARRELLQLGAAGLAALGVGHVPAAASPQAPGSGQGPQPPVPPSPEDVVNPAAQLVENWTEPWIWRPADWPGQALALHVVSNNLPPRATSPGNRFTPLFGYNGSSPGPTIRMRGDETLAVKVRNLMPRNYGVCPKGPAPDIFELPTERLMATFCEMSKAEGMPCDAPPPAPIIFKHFDKFFDGTPVELVDTTCVLGMANIPHGAHTTNLHTHGLHVEPGLNANGTHGDNTLLRIIPRGDWAARQVAEHPECRRLAPHERVAEGDFELTPGDVQRVDRVRTGRAPQPHPPGTFWYHPHSHGATHDQVASGLAGFLIVEGDVDDAINEAMTGTRIPDVTIPAGPYDYRERLMMIQRVEVSSLNIDAGPRRMQARLPPPTVVNGQFSPTVMTMRPGAVERWRVLNASVDGRGFKQFMVLEGQFVFADRQLWKVLPGATEGEPRRVEAASRQDVEDAKVPLAQLSFDGLTLVSMENGRARYRIRDLARQNAGTANPLDREPERGETPSQNLLRNIENCYRNGDSIRAAYVRPNSVLLANANRADVLFKAPRDAAGRVYTVFAQEFPIVTDNLQQRAQIGVARGQDGFTPANPAPADVVVGYISVRGEPVPGGDFDVMSLNDRLPDVPPFLQPIADDELRTPAEEAARRGVPAGSFRSRVLSYSGYGPTDFPIIEVPEAFAAAHPELNQRLWEEVNGARVLLPPFVRTMAINPTFDLSVTPNPPAPRKFCHADPARPMPLVDTAEEWVLYNCSTPLWSHVNTVKVPQPGQYNLHYRSYPLSRAEGQRRNATDPEFQITTKGADHPFHIHVNPCWVTRIEVPDEQGRLHNILGEPQWMDTVSIPRAGGRVVFRSRFADYVGRWVNHCHILLHEDFGMMQEMECTARAEQANGNAKTRVASHAMSSEEVSAIYPPPSLELMYRQSLTFVDPDPELGQVFPGFEIEVPDSR